MVCRLLLCVVSCASALGQSMRLVRNDAVPTTGADIATFQRNVTHFTFDLQGTTSSNDWTGSEISLDVVGAGSIWHASDARIAISHPPAAPDVDCYVHDLLTPNLINNAEGQANTRMYTTFFTRPGQRFVLDPFFASPGLPPPDNMSCPPIPPIVSTDRRIRGMNTEGTEIPLAWFDIVSAALNNTVLARFTLEVPADRGGLVVNPTNTDGLSLFATFRGRISIPGPPGGFFVADIYQAIPEPGTLWLMLLAGATVLARRGRLGFLHTKSPHRTG